MTGIRKVVDKNTQKVFVLKRYVKLRKIFVSAA